MGIHVQGWLTWLIYCRILSLLQCSWENISGNGEATNIRERERGVIDWGLRKYKEQSVEWISLGEDKIHSRNSREIGHKSQVMFRFYCWREGRLGKNKMRLWYSKHPMHFPYEVRKIKSLLLVSKREKCRKCERSEERCFVTKGSIAGLMGKKSLWSQPSLWLIFFFNKSLIRKPYYSWYYFQSPILYV